MTKILLNILFTITFIISMIFCFSENILIFILSFLGLVISVWCLHVNNVEDDIKEVKVK